MQALPPLINNRCGVVLTGALYQRKIETRRATQLTGAIYFSQRLSQEKSSGCTFTHKTHFDGQNERF